MRLKQSMDKESGECWHSYVMSRKCFTKDKVYEYTDSVWNLFLRCSSFCILLYPFCSLVLELFIPSAQCRSTLDPITCSPSHSCLIKLLANIIVRTDNIELAVCHFLEAIFSNLTWQPCASFLGFHRFFVADWSTIAAQSSECPSRDQQVDADVGMCGSQVVGKVLCKCFDG